MLAAIIVAAGSSQRIGFDKIAAIIAGKPVLEHSIHAFASAASVNEIIVVARSDRAAELRKMVEPIGRRVIVVAGGVERQDSVRNGMNALGENISFVAVHDAARPLVVPEQIEAVYMAAREYGAASLAAPVADTLKKGDSEGFVVDSIDRSNVYAMQTPQIFARDLLEEAYAGVERARATVTDEVSAVGLVGRQVFLVPTEGPNFKITFKRDLELAEMILRQRLAER
jgi:2-C-methyl-D-erythritol 4-phosphate cytidylyltransferase